MIGIYQEENFKRPENFEPQEQSTMNFQQRVDYNIRYVETKLNRALELGEIQQIKEIVNMEFKEDNQELIKCPKCDDLGYLSPAVKDKTNVKYVHCGCKSGKLSLQDKVLLSWTTLDIKEKTFDSYKTNNKFDVYQKNKVQKWCQNQKENLCILFGNNGTGKTHLAKGCVNYFASCGKQGTYISFQRFALEIEKFNNENDERIHYLEKLMNTPILIIDEVFFGYENSKYKSSKLEEVLLTRFEENKKTLITTNKSLEIFSEQLVSRFNECLLINSEQQKDKRFKNEH